MPSSNELGTEYRSVASCTDRKDPLAGNKCEKAIKILAVLDGEYSSPVVSQSTVPVDIVSGSIFLTTEMSGTFLEHVRDL